MLAIEPAKLDPNDALEGLTSKEYQFARLVFEGSALADAYRAVYDCSGMSDVYVGKRASEVYRKPEVQGKVRALRVEADRLTTLAPSLNADWVMNGIRDLAVNADSDSVRLAAYVHLGKTRAINLFGSDPAPDTRKARTPEEIERELVDIIRRLQPSIDGTARDVTPASDQDETPPPRRQRKPKR